MEIVLKQVREDKGLTQTELAMKSGLSRVTINKIENGTKKNVHVNTIVKLSSALGVPITDIFIP